MSKHKVSYSQQNGSTCIQKVRQFLFCVQLFYLHLAIVQTRHMSPITGIDQINLICTAELLNSPLCFLCDYHTLQFRGNKK